MRTGPQVRRGTRLADESLHRAKAHDQQRGLIRALCIARERGVYGRYRVHMRPNAVVGRARVGWQHGPQHAKFVGIVTCLGAEAPEGEECLAKVFVVFLDETLEMVLADAFDLLHADVQVERHWLDAFARQRVNQLGLFGELHRLKLRVPAHVIGSRPIGAVGGGSQMVSNVNRLFLLELFVVELDPNAIFLTHGRACLQPERLTHFNNASTFMSDRVAHEHELLFCWVVQPGSEFLGVVGHVFSPCEGE